MPKHGPYLQTMVVVWVAILLIGGVCYFILRFGNPGYLIALAGLLFVSYCVERDFLHDWMGVADLLKLYPPAGDIVLLAVGYTLFAAGTILCVSVYQQAIAASANPWKKYLARSVGLCAAVASAYWLGGVYLKMTSSTPLPAVPVSQQRENPLEDVLPLLEEFFVLDDVEGFDPKKNITAPKRHETGEPIAVVYSKLVEKLQEPAWATFDTNSGSESRRSQETILLKLMSLSDLLNADIEQAENQKDFDGALPYAMALLQLEDSLQHSGLMMHRNMGGGVIRLGGIRNGISQSNARQTLATLRRMDRGREPIETTMQREQAWEEQTLNWRARLGRPLSGGGWRARLDLSLSGRVPAVRIVGGEFNAELFSEIDRAKHAWFRLLIAELALRVFHDEHGRYPGDLSELVPQYLDSLPLDPYSDQPLVYRLQGEKYRLYSIWANRKDDHGKIGKCDITEIQKYEAMDADLDTSVETFRQSVAAGVAAAIRPPKASWVEPADDKSATPEN